MPVSSGVRTVGGIGSGADYADWAIAFADIAWPLTGHLTFTQIADVTLPAAAIINAVGKNHAGWYLTLTSNAPRVHKTFCNSSPFYNMELYSGSGGQGGIIVQDLNFEALGGNGASGVLLIASPSFGNLLGFCIVQRCVFNGRRDLGGGYGTGLITTWPGAAVRQGFRVLNNHFINMGSVGYELNDSDATSLYDNNTAYNTSRADVVNGTGFFAQDGVLGGIQGTFRNNISVDNEADFFFGAGSGSLGPVSHNTSTDATAIGPNVQHGITAASVFITTGGGAYADPYFLRHKPGATTATNGTVGTTTVGIYGNARPGSDGLYSRGADEFESLPPMTVDSIVPNSGTTVGGTGVAVNGTNFIGGVVPYLDNVPLTGTAQFGYTQVTGNTPAHAAGIVDVKVVRTLDGAQAFLYNGFTYIQPGVYYTYIAQNYVINGVVVGTSLLDQSMDLSDFVDPLIIPAQIEVVFKINRSIFPPNSGDNIIQPFGHVTSLNFFDDPFVIIIYTARISGEVIGTAQVLSNFPINYLFSAGNPNGSLLVVTFADTGNSINVDASMLGLIIATSEVTFSNTGGFVVERAAAGSRESSYEATGYRNSFPFLVYHIDALTDADISVVPPNRSFLVSPRFTSTPGDPFQEQGAGAMFIGTKVVPQNGTPYLVFRKPEEYEVVYYVLHQDNESCLYRYELNRETGRFLWQQYRSNPQRNLEGQYAFYIFDPDKIYEYYACMWGALYYEWSYDSYVLALQFDADKCASFYLPALAANFGFILPNNDSMIVKRRKVKSAVPSFKFKGTERGVALRLLSLGYRGYVREIWINPGAKQWKFVMNYDGAAGNIPMVYTTVGNPHITVVGFKGGGDNVAAYGYIQFRHGRTPSAHDLGEVSPTTGDTIKISDGVLTKTFEFIEVASLLDPVTPSVPAYIPVKFLRFEDVRLLADRFMVAVAAQGFNFTITDVGCVNVYGPPIGTEQYSSSDYGTLDSTDPACRSDFLEIPHGYTPDEPELYWPSSRVSIHLNDRQNNPVDITAEVKQRIWDELRFDVLPVHADIRFFATDIALANPAEGFEIGETFTITQV